MRTTTAFVLLACATMMIVPAAEAEPTSIFPVEQELTQGKCLHFNPFDTENPIDIYDCPDSG